MKRHSVLLYLIFLGSAIQAQSNLAVKYFGLTVHPFGDRTANYQPYKIDSKAVLVFNYGAFIEYERFIREQSFSIKVAQGLFADCSNGFAGATFIGLKGLLRPMGRHRLGLAIGPLFIVRQSWSRFSDYKGTGIFKEKKDTKVGDIQYAFYPYGLDIEYDYNLSPKCDLSVSFTPGFPFVMTFAVGVKYWFNKDFKERSRKLLKIK